MDSGLTFDWDGVGIEDELVNVELQELFEFFGEGKVWYRISSSGKGIHVMIADMYYEPTTNQVLLKPIALESKIQMEFRKKSLLECQGRFISDIHRMRNGLRTSRVFIVKNGSKSSEWKSYYP
jgi:hypothetical protein